ncbi:hypothetical protein L345_18324, partial [Ophiophagus hannah]
RKEEGREERKEEERRKERKGKGGREGRRKEEKKEKRMRGREGRREQERRRQRKEGKQQTNRSYRKKQTKHLGRKREGRKDPCSMLERNTKRTSFWDGQVRISGPRTATGQEMCFVEAKAESWTFSSAHELWQKKKGTAEKEGAGWSH